MNYLSYTALGLTAGIFGGLFGIGGGIILIPGMVFLFGLTQHQAQGTSLAVMVPPIGLLAAMRYYYSGNVKLGMAAFICVGFVIGGWIGAHFIQQVPDALLKRTFGVFLLFVSLQMILTK
jgi:uncharacterized membrane protein YfcA